MPEINVFVFVTGNHVETMCIVFAMVKLNI